MMTLRPREATAVDSIRSRCIGGSVERVLASLAIACRLRMLSRPVSGDAKEQHMTAASPKTVRTAAISVEDLGPARVLFTAAHGASEPTDCRRIARHCGRHAQEKIRSTASRQPGTAGSASAI